jgi:cyclopropane-fatty-acyl-phospholipid synthase
MTTVHAETATAEVTTSRWATSSALHHAKRAMATLFGPPPARPFAVRYWDGTAENPRTAVPFTLVLTRPGALRRMLWPPSELSLVEAYLSGDVDVEGDLGATISLADTINAHVKSPRVLASLTRDLLALPKHESAVDTVQQIRSERVVPIAGSVHDRSRDRAAIQYHYDVGNDFYKLFLDDRMVYSCAYFVEPDFTLDRAQEAKLEHICRKLRLRPGERLLDIGCGWGGLIMHAVQRHGVRALGITLSEQQRALAQARIEAAGLQDSCRVEIRDYRDLADVGPFDKIASVGMVEHVGVDHLPEYFESAYRVLEPGGLFLNHGIVQALQKHRPSWRERIEDRLWRRDSFIDQYVFPDGKLGPFDAVASAAENAGFELRDAESLREHYEQTLHEWVRRLMAREREAVALVGRQTFRVWRLYMTASKYGFATGRLGIIQTLLAKQRDGRVTLPRTRADLYQ